MAPVKRLAYETCFDKIQAFLMLKLHNCYTRHWRYGI